MQRIRQLFRQNHYQFSDKIEIFQSKDVITSKLPKDMFFVIFNFLEEKDLLKLICTSKDFLKFVNLYLDCFHGPKSVWAIPNDAKKFHVIVGLHNIEFGASFGYKAPIDPINSHNKMIVELFSSNQFSKSTFTFYKKMNDAKKKQRDSEKFIACNTFGELLDRQNNSRITQIPFFKVKYTRSDDEKLLLESAHYQLPCAPITEETIIPVGKILNKN